MASNVDEQQVSLQKWYTNNSGTTLAVFLGDNN